MNGQRLVSQTKTYASQTFQYNKRSILVKRFFGEKCTRTTKSVLVNLFDLAAYQNVLKSKQQKVYQIPKKI